MATHKHQALIEQPIGAVWELVGDPARFPEWAGEVVEVTGLAEVAEGETFRQVTRTPLGKASTTFEIETLDDLHEIRLRCRASGYYSHWVLTPAQAATFAEVEIGVEPTAMPYRVMYGVLGRRYLRRIAEHSIDGIRATLAGSDACSARERPMTPPRS